jgi:hypothetical protein
MKTFEKSQVIVQHSENCFVKNHSHPWSGIPVGTFWANKKAGLVIRGRKSTNELWVKVSCNDPKCPAIKAVHYSVLSEA